MIGDWMGTYYPTTGQRCDIRLFLDHDGRYEWKSRFDNNQERREFGRWTTEEGETVISLQPDSTDDRPRRWRVLSVTTCEESNILLVLRPIVLATPKLPILFYRVHCDGRGYGTGWQERLSHPKT